MSGNQIKHAILRSAKATGLFEQARKRSAGMLRIICYHGFSLEDEHVYHPGMFVSESTLRSRMNLLRDGGYNVVGLEEAVTKLKDGTLEPDTVVITVDDGFYGTLAIAAPVWADFGYLPTIYLTTFYMENQHPIYNFLFINMMLRSHRKTVDLSHIAPGLGDRIPVSGCGADEPSWLEAARLIDQTHPLSDRDDVFEDIGERLHVDYESLRNKRMYHLVSAEEVRKLDSLGMDFQLHTHRHRLPHDSDLIKQEIETNREVMRGLCSSNLAHLCYPSGKWHEAHFAPLAELGVITGTTCDPGANQIDTNPLKLFRFLDMESVSDLEFEAEVSGCMSFLRPPVNYLRSKVKSGPA